MIPRITRIRLSLVLAVTLAACGGGGETTEDGDVVVDPVEGAAESVADDAAAAVDATTEAAAEATDEVVEAASEAGEVVTDAAAEAGDAVTDAASEGWVAMQENWEGSAGLVKDRWADLTEEEILVTGGDREQLVGLVQERYGLERDVAEAEVEEWAGSL